jgi:hypothetical protein
MVTKVSSAMQDTTVGGVVQVVNVMDGAVATGTTVIPHNDTIPQNTEGTEFMTLAITPTNASNKLIITVKAFLTQGTVPNWLLGALFQDTTASALAVSQAGYVRTTITTGFMIDIKHYMTAGTVSTTTFKFRAGSDAASTVTFNGQGGTRKFGGVLASSMTIEEIKV